MIGQPARTTSSTEGALLIPLWQEYALYSDATFRGQIDLGPHRVLLAFGDFRALIGRPRLQLVLRVRNHLADPDFTNPDWDEDVTGYHGGDVGDEIAALLHWP